MKKLIFTFVVALMALAANAQKIMTFNQFAPGNNPLVYHTDNLFMYIVDNKNKMECDEGIRTFRDGKRFTTRLKTGGRSARGNQIFLSVKAKGKLHIYAASSSSEENRPITVMKGTTVMVTDVIENYNKMPIVVDIEKIGEYQIMYPEGPINIYGIYLEEEKPEVAPHP